MPRDQRLFMTFPIDMHRHPKVERLSPEVRWTFFEMNGEARIADNDGVFSAEDAEFMWPVAHLAALVASHPSRPLVRRGPEGEYVIRDYAEHQQTKDERERLAEVARENGKRGGRPRKNPETQAKAAGFSKKPSGTQAEPSGTQAKAESESESESEGLTTYVPESQSLDTRAREMTDSISPVIQGMASRAGITDMAALITAIRERTGCLIEPAYAVALTNELVGRAKGPVKNPQRYVVSCLAQSPGEIEQHIYESGWAA